MDKKVYVLIPVYNVQKVVGQCLDSVINQTYKNWEMILVDDGSTDKSGKICDEYAEKDSRIRVIHQKNSGSSIARLNALKAIDDTEDTYCMFCDSDDVIPKMAIELFLKTAEENNCTIVSGDFTKFSNFIKPDLGIDLKEPANLKIYKKDEIIDKLYCSCFGYDGITVSLVSKIYKTDFISGIFNEIEKWPHYFGDDLYGTLRMLPKAECVATIDNTVYYYRYGGGTNRFMKTFVDDCIFLYHEKKKYAEIYQLTDYRKKLIDVEMKNLAQQYLVMCVRSKTYPHGGLDGEIEYITSLPDFYGAACSIDEKMLGMDHSETAGFTQAFVDKNTSELKRIIRQKANERRLVRFIKNII